MNQTAELHTQTSHVDTSLRVRFARYLLPFAVISATTGQYILLRARPNTPSELVMQIWGGVCLLLGTLAFGIGASAFPLLKYPGRADMLEPDATDAMKTPWGPTRWFSVTLAAAAILLFAFRGETPIVVALWLAGILLLFAAEFQGTKLHWPTINTADRGYLEAMLLLLIAVLFTRTYHLTTLPYNLDGDFASVGLQARALATGQQQMIFAYGWANIPMLGYLPPWITMLVFGTGLTGLNASGVIEGLFVIAGTYLLGRELFSARMGLLAAVLLTVSYADLAASRQAVYIDPVFFMLFAVYFLVIGMKQRLGWAMVLSGVLTALCIEMYYSGRLIIPLLGLILLYALIFKRKWLFSQTRFLLTWLVAGLITLGPMLVVFGLNYQAFISHTQDVFILNPALVKHMEGVYQVNTIPALLWQQAGHTALLFHYYPDKGTQFALERPFLDPFTGVLFALGIGGLIFNWRRPAAWLILSWILLTVILGCYLTGNPPFWPRLMILLPPVMLAAALPLDLLCGLVLRQTARFGHVLPVALSAAMLAVLVAVGVMNWNTYVKVKGSYAAARTRIARYLEAQPSSVRAYLVSNDMTYQDREFDFLIPGRLIGSLTPEQAKAAIVPIGSRTLLILGADQADLAAQLAPHYHGGPIGGNSPNETAFYVFHVP